MRYVKFEIRSILVFVIGIFCSITIGEMIINTAFAETNYTNVTSSNGGEVVVFRDQDFYIYAGSIGETVSYNFDPKLKNSLDFFYDTRITLARPDGSQQTLCNMTAAAIKNDVTSGTVGQICKGSFNANQVGIYEIRFKLLPEGAAGTGDPSAGWDWTILPSGGLGKVWVRRLAAYNQNTLGAFSSTDMVYWMVRADGYLYKTKVFGFNGVNWVLRSDSVGVVEKDVTPCAPAYTSYTNRSTGDGTAIAANYTIADIECGGEAKIFFYEPSNSLPAKDPTSGEWIKPYSSDYKIIAQPSIDVSYTHGGAANYAGKFHIRVQNYFGSLTWQPIINGVDGDHIPISVELSDDLNTSFDLDFDGKDPANNELISLSSQFTIRISAVHPGEIHIVHQDVEVREGISVERLTTLMGNDNGQTDKGIIFWNDTNLANVRCGNRWPDLSTVNRTENGMNSLNGIRGTHGWIASAGGGYAQCTTDEGDFQPFGTHSWGDERSIEDWTYDTTVTVAGMSPELNLHPGLRVTKEVAIDRPSVNQENTYTITVRNEADAEDDSFTVVPTHGIWTVIDEVDLRLEIVGIPTITMNGQPTGSCIVEKQSNENSLVTCSSDTTLYPMGSQNANYAIVQITVRVTPDAVGEEIVNTAFTGGGGDLKCSTPGDPNNPARCSDSATVNSPLNPPETGVVQMVIRVAGTVALLGLSAWLIGQKGYLVRKR